MILKTEVTNTSQSWSQKTTAKKTGVFRETKLKSYTAQKIPAKKTGILKEIKLEFSPGKRKEYHQRSLKKVEKPGPLSNSTCLQTETDGRT